MEPRMTTEEADALLATMSDDDFPTATAEEDIDDAQAQRLIEAAHRALGRPSMTGPGRHSPNFTLRLPQDMKDRLAQVAQQQQRRESDVAREALARYLETVV